MKTFGHFAVFQFFEYFIFRDSLLLCLSAWILSLPVFGVVICCCYVDLLHFFSIILLSSIQAVHLFQSSNDHYFNNSKNCRGSFEQWSLAEFAKAKHAHIVATIDHINATMLWTRVCLSNTSYLLNVCEFLNVI